ncbi:MAG: NAD(P)H-hydrate dehydratase [Verrucomicrobiota bacterium]
MNIHSHPVLSCSDAVDYERAFFSKSAESEDVVMFRAGRAIAEAIEDDFEEISGFPAKGKAIVLAGKGHNSGDALICANTLKDRHPDLDILVLLAFPVTDLKDNVRAPYELLRVRSKVFILTDEADIDEVLSVFADGKCIDLCIDGLFGMNLSPPLRGNPLSLIEAVNRFPAVRLRAAVDLPSGIGDESDPKAFNADFTYATGIAKLPVSDNRSINKVGRLRYLDLGFFSPKTKTDSDLRVLLPTILWQLASFRQPTTHKRTYGHLLVLAGSESMPGACIMATMAAANSGVGLLTVGTVERVAAAGVIAQPEAMWTSVPSSESGALHSGIIDQLNQKLTDYTAILAGPGLGRSAEAHKLVRHLVEKVDRPIVLDADGLFPEITQSLSKRPVEFLPIVITPHLGEWKRIGGHPFEDNGAEALKSFCRTYNCVTVLKGPRTRIANASTVYLSPFGGPVLARGGTGDLLAGMVGSLLSQDSRNPTTAAVLATVWHGRAADCLARAQGNAAVKTTRLLDYLPEALGFKH